MQVRLAPTYCTGDDVLTCSMVAFQRIGAKPTCFHERSRPKATNLPRVRRQASTSWVHGPPDPRHHAHHALAHQGVGFHAGRWPVAGRPAGAGVSRATQGEHAMNADDVDGPAYRLQPPRGPGFSQIPYHAPKQHREQCLLLGPEVQEDPQLLRRHEIRDLLLCFGQRLAEASTVLWDCVHHECWHPRPWGSCRNSTADSGLMTSPAPGPTGNWSLSSPATSGINPPLEHSRDSSRKPAMALLRLRQCTRTPLRR